MSSPQIATMPTGWAEAKLGDLVEPRSGKALPSDSPDARFIGMEHIEAHTMRLLGTVSASEMKSAANVFTPFDVLYGRLRSYLNKVYQPDFGGLCSSEFIVLPESSAICGGFLKYRLNAGDFVSFASHINTGDRPRVDWDQIKLFRLLLPPRKEQQRIVDALDELLSDLNAGIEALRTAKAKLELYRASVLKAALEGTLTADWRKKHPASELASVLLERILKERRQRWEKEQLRKFEEQGKKPPANWKAKYKEPIAPETSKLPALPDGWCWTTIDSLIMQGPQNGLYMPESAYGSGTPILRIDDFQQWWIKAPCELKRVVVDEQSLETYALEENDLVINRVNSMTHLGKCVLIPGEHHGVIFESNMMRMKLSGQVSLRLLKVYLSSIEGRSRLTKGAKWAVNQASINQEDVRKTPVPLAPMSEQVVIVEHLDELLSSIENAEKTILFRLEAKRSLSQAILNHGFGGKLIEQNPTDEPASELLKRIAAERAARARQKKTKQSSKTGMRRRTGQQA